MKNYIIFIYIKIHNSVMGYVYVFYFKINKTLN